MLIVPADLEPHAPGFVAADAEAGKVQRAIRIAEAQVAKFCGWPRIGSSAPSMESATRTLYLDGPRLADSAELALPVWPVSSVTTVHQSVTEVWDSASLVASSAYTLLPEFGRIRLLPTANAAWYAGRRQIRVVFVAGWTSESVQTEPDLVDAIARLAAHTLTVSRGGRQESASRAGGSVQYRSRRMPADVRQLLVDYMLPQGLGIGGSAT